jgi:hypothetical protein
MREQFSRRIDAMIWARGLRRTAAGGFDGIGAY